jgi:hypothetical protein
MLKNALIKGQIRDKIFLPWAAPPILRQFPSRRVRHRYPGETASGEVAGKNGKNNSPSSRSSTRPSIPGFLAGFYEEMDMVIHHGEVPDGNPELFFGFFEEIKQHLLDFFALQSHCVMVNFGSDVIGGSIH